MIRAPERDGYDTIAKFPDYVPQTGDLHAIFMVFDNKYAWYEVVVAEPWDGVCFPLFYRKGNGQIIKTRLHPLDLMFKHFWVLRNKDEARVCRDDPYGVGKESETKGYLEGHTGLRWL